MRRIVPNDRNFSYIHTHVKYAWSLRCWYYLVVVQSTCEAVYCICPSNSWRIFGAKLLRFSFPIFPGNIGVPVYSNFFDIMIKRNQEKNMKLFFWFQKLSWKSSLQTQVCYSTVYIDTICEFLIVKWWICLRYK